MRIVYRDGSRFVEGDGDFVDDVGLEKVKVQLSLSPRVEGESAYLTFQFSVFSWVPVFLETGCSKLDDVGTRFVSQILGPRPKTCDIPSSFSLSLLTKSSLDLFLVLGIVTSPLIV